MGPGKDHQRTNEGRISAVKSRRFSVAVGVLAIALLGLFLAGCCLITALSAQEPKSKKEFESRIYEAPRKITLRALKKILKERGYELRKDESKEGVLESDFTVDAPVRSKAKVIVTPLSRRKTEVKLKLHVEKRSFWSKQWKPMKINVSVYEDVFDAVEMQIYREYIEQIKENSK